VDDILLIFDSNHTNIQMIHEDFNALHPKLQFTVEAEEITLWTTTEPSQTSEPLYTESPPSMTPSFPTPPTTPRTTNTQQLDSYSVD